MGSNLPPGVSIGDPDAPWNERVPEPDRERPDRQEKQCVVCCPPPDIHERVKYNGSLPFCEQHDRDDWEAKLEYEAKMRREEMERHRYTEEPDDDS